MHANPNPKPSPNPNPNPHPHPNPKPTQVPYQDIAGLLVGYLHYFMNDNLKPDDVVQLPAAPKKGGRASAPGATKGNRKRGGRKQRVIESY